MLTGKSVAIHVFLTLSKLSLCMYSVYKVVVSNSRIEFIPARAIRLPDNISESTSTKRFPLKLWMFHLPGSMHVILGDKRFLGTNLYEGSPFNIPRSGKRKGK